MSSVFLTAPMHPEHIHQETWLSGWARIWSSVLNAYPALPTFLAVVGTAFAAMAIFQFILANRRGGGGNERIGWSLVFATMITAPNVVMPLVLTLIAFLVNFVVRLLSGAV